MSISYILGWSLYNFSSNASHNPTGKVLMLSPHFPGEGNRGLERLKCKDWGDQVSQLESGNRNV
jgi:hypothetical protein